MDSVETYFPGSSTGSHVGGELLSGTGQAVDLVDPTTGQVLTTYADGGADVVDAAVAAATEGARRWQQMTASARGQALWQLGQEVRAEAEPLAHLEATVAGKPLRDAGAEVAKVAEMFEYYAGWADKQHGEVIPVPTSHLNYTIREPYGVIAQITPWNAPVFTGGWQIAPALAAGNAVVIKPSESTPLSTVVLARLAERAGVPAGAVNVIAGLGPTAGARLVTHPGVNKVVFVGSPATGRRIAAAAAAELIPCVLELGGKSANIVFADANISRAVGGAAAAIFSGAGQSCVAGSRLLVQRQAYAEVVERLAELADRITVGPPLSESTQVGPLQNKPQLERVRQMVGAAAQAGARAVTKSTAMPAHGYFYRPTVLADVTNSDAIAQQEVFGPVVAAIPFEDEDEAIALANDTRFGLAGAVWTGGVERAHRVARGIRAGTVWVNSYKTINVMSPFGGFADSGFGRSSGTDGLAEYTQAKSVWVETDDEAPLAFGY
ncbi:aldehyde dehydrogenase family protein [Pseudactinotalea sp. Z1748]|uniref:aldehyde dehydrogenase family protein n=1 Tax=Pseudactinotalea sp. Z1748 TaxID=3413027 RepID=UPI003C79CC40